jgi:cysteine desulfurase
LHLVRLDANGHVDLAHLEELLAAHEGKSLVSLMHANNEVGNLLDVEKAGALCEKYGAIFHCDMVQTIGHYPINLHNLPSTFRQRCGT